MDTSVWLPAAAAKAGVAVGGLLTWWANVWQYKRQRRDRMLPAVHEFGALLRRMGRRELGEDVTEVPSEDFVRWREALVPFEHELARDLRELMCHPDLESRDQRVHGNICVRIGDALDDYFWEQTGGPYPGRSRG